MFKSAYTRLTLWYVAILMAISFIFSIWVYQEAMHEVHSGLSGPVVVKIQDRFGPLTRDDFNNAIQKQYADSQGRILLNLILLNAVVLVIGGAASYGMARRTMRPIEEALEAQNRFSADASHELRTPLAAMKTELEVALRDPNLAKADMKELLHSNLEEIDRMSGLAQGLLTLARSGENIHIAGLQAKQIVQEACDRMRPLADAKKISLKSELTEFKVMAEPKSLATIVGILLDNAIKYSPENAEITVAMRRQDGHGLIAVTDHGPGISAKDAPRIFDRFYRADGSRTTQVVAGHGLGLSIAQKLVGALRGTITLQSTPGKGCVFTVKLPLA